MSFNFIRDHAGRWPVGRMCRILEVSAMRDHMRTEPPLAALMIAAQRQRPA